VATEYWKIKLFRFSLALYELLRQGDEVVPPTGGRAKKSHGFDNTQLLTVVE
jgi:hypothetical protein